MSRIIILELNIKLFALCLLSSIQGYKLIINSITLNETLFLGILTKDSIQTLTAKKQPLQKVAVSGTAETAVKPLTAAEMRAAISCKI